MTTNTNRTRFSLGTILFLIFLTLKLTGNIDWSWWWVTCPLWIGIALVIAIWLIGVFFGFFAILIKTLFGGGRLTNRYYRNKRKF